MEEAAAATVEEVDLEVTETSEGWAETERAAAAVWVDADTVVDWEAAERVEER